MKIAILGDTHFGSRGDHKVFHEYFEKFYNDVFFPYLKNEGITDVIQLGDIFDRRKYINFFTLSESKRYFFNKLQEGNINLYTLVGNHDIYWRETTEVNSTSLVLGEYKNVHIFTEPASISIGGTSIDLIPWICADNHTEIQDFIKESKSDLCMGHFEIAGFAMYKGMEAHEGLEVKTFEKYEAVFSGHFHTRSNNGNITYTGVPYEMTWSDYNDTKGFYVFDTDTRKYQFIPNPYTIFYRIEYDDQSTVVDLDSLDLKGTFVKLVVVNKTDFYKFDLFVNKLYTKGCYEIKIVEDLSVYSDGKVSDEINLEDTLSVLTNYIDSIETDSDVENVKKFMKTLYLEAINTEV